MYVEGFATDPRGGGLTSPAPATERPDRMIGTVIAGRYRVQRLIARGGMGTVYEARQEPLGRTVALKVLDKRHGADDQADFERRFYLEAQSLSLLEHPNTVTLFDYGEADGTYYLVMEFVDGRPLSKVLQEDGPLVPERCLDLMLQVCRALKEAHGKSIIHRDLKPSNLLVRRHPDGREEVKVVDFGLVKITEGETLTMSGMILGSPHCMSPEQVRGSTVDARADVYAVGVLLFRCLTGRYPFHGATTAATMVAHVQTPAPSLAEVVPDLEAPSGLDAIIQRCLAKDPSERYPSMAELIADLAACAAVPREAFTSVSTVITSVQRVRRQRLVAAGAAGLAALALVGALWFAGSGPSGQPAVPPAPTAAGSAPEEASATVVAVRFQSSPTGATVWDGGVALGLTPFELPLQASAEPVERSFRFTAPGHEEAQVLARLVTGSPVEVVASLEPSSAAPPVASAPRVDTPRRKVPQDDATTDAPPEEPEVRPPEGYKSSPYD